MQNGKLDAFTEGAMMCESGKSSARKQTFKTPQKLED
jgi:hypothetical protein